MKTKLFLSLSLALPMFASCGEATDAASNAADGAASMAEKGADALGDLDLSSMTPDAIKGKATELMGSLTEGLGGIKDVASAEKFKAMAGPIVDSLGAMKDKLGAALPGADALKGALSSFKPEGGIGDIVGPIIEKLKALVG
jgi:uncharacterized protein YjbJ (UPF0337 family)